ncbi:MAG: hypothetical protein RIF41_04080, partial [Polyangiaceae bacterium]
MKVRAILGTIAVGAGLVAACGTDGSVISDDEGTGPGTGAGSSQGGSGQGGVGFGGFGQGGGQGAMGPTCKVPPDADDAVIGTCEDIAPADSFDPAVQWEWTAPPPSDPSALIIGSFVTPLVGNFTDDNGDGDID